MKTKTMIFLSVLFFIMAVLLPLAVPSGAVTTVAHSRYMDSIPLDDEYAFLND
jgi:hypothetical protein